MTIQHPVHPDDVTQLLKIRRYLIGHRITNGWNQNELSRRINGTEGMAYDLESNQTWQWRLSRLQAWAKPFDLRLTAIVRFDGPDECWLNEVIEEHPEVAPMLSLSRSKGSWDKWQRIYLTSALSVARKELGLSAEQMGQRLGVTRKAIWAWETGGDELMLPKVLGYARALGGMIELGLEEDERQEPQEDPRDSHS